MKALILISISTLCTLSGCSPFQKAQRYDVPVVVPCLKNPPERPVYLFKSLPPAMSDVESAEQVRTLWKDFERADKYGRDWETAAAGCLIVP